MAVGQVRISNSGDVSFLSTLKTGQLLQYDATTSTWQNKSLLTTSTVNASTTLSDAGAHVFCNASSAALTVTLPAATIGNGAIIRVTKTDASTNEVKVVAPAGAKMNGVTVSGALAATTTKTANYTAVSLNHVKCDASAGLFTVTLPTPTNGSWVRVTKIDSSPNTVLVQPSSGTIDGDVAYSANRQFVGQNFYADGTNWHYLPDTEATTYWQNTTQDFVSDGTTWWAI